jgi:hypothetical protein
MQKVRSTMKLFKKVTLQASMLAGLCGLVGCDDKAGMNTFFGPEDESRRIHLALTQQANNGAREDATLQPVHFTGGKLNSLGAAKLARLVPDQAGDEVNVYLDVADNDLTVSRKDAVASYLRACGVDDGRMKLTLGGNPNLSYPSAPGLANLPKTETGGTSSESDSGSGPSYSPQSMSPGLSQ